MQIKSKFVKFLALAAILSVSSFIFVSANGTPAEAATTTFTAAGSTSVQPILEMLAQEYMATHRGIRINVQGGGSSAGVKAAQTGAAEIGMASRDLKPSEKGLWQYVLAYDGITVVVHPANSVSNLTLEQVKDIFTGKIANWKALGGDDAAINVINREAGSGTRGAFGEIVLEEELFADNAIVQGSTGAVKATVSMDLNGIGYISLAALDPKVKPVKVDGVAATAENVSNKSYKIARPFNLLAKSEPTGAAADFINWLGSSEVAKEIITEEGLTTK